MQSLSQLNENSLKNESQFYRELQSNKESFNTYSVLKYYTQSKITLLVWLPGSSPMNLHVFVEQKFSFSFTDFALLAFGIRLAAIS